MTDLEKTIRGLECKICPNAFCGNCEYYIRYENNPDTGWCDRDTIYRDALSLLKAQKSAHSTTDKTYNDMDEDDIADVMNRIDDALEETKYQTLGYDNISTPFFQIIIGER